MWSPSFVPKCKDWPGHVDVVGDFRNTDPEATTGSSRYQPPPALAAYLAAGSRPLYIGFRSMVIVDSQALVAAILEAAHTVGCRVLLQSGWTKYGPDNSKLSEEVMVIGAMPHDWLFDQVLPVYSAEP